MARILVVDDHPSVRALLRDVLELAGHVVRVAEDGYAALRAVAAERPDVVVLDVVMPGMDGHEVLARLRERHALSIEEIVVAEEKIIFKLPAALAATQDA